MEDAPRCSRCGSDANGDLSPSGLCAKCQSDSTLETLTLDRTEFPQELHFPNQIGPYKIRKILGRGGMGIVYLAEQEQPIRRKVALKVIKLGMDTKEVIARFETERQALAIMNHPHIARVLDAGATERGLPFFVMEYVPGSPICDYCDRQHLNTRERLDLFVMVCLAIQHAHQKGIIHRDVKPSNVLVYIEDGKPAPKVIDFGVAKAMNQPLTEKTLFTKQGVLVGTPAYMSPEQIDMTGVDIDTTTDIYSLGVLLYELLVGALPFGAFKANAIWEFQRLILEKDPPTLTKRLHSLGDAASEIAKRRHTSVEVLRKQLSGDLDWIIMKAMEKDRTRRYASASEFATDIRRFLAEEPVLARSPSVPYKLSKFIRRHRIGLSAGLVLALALIAGMTGTTIGLVRARRAERIAQNKAAQAKAINDFLQETLGSANPVEGSNRDITVLEALEASVSNIHRSFEGQPEIEAELKTNIGITFLRLGHYDKAEQLLKESLQMFQQQFGPEDPILTAPLNGLAVLKQECGAYKEAEGYYRRAMKLAIRNQGEENPDVISILSNLGLVLQDQGALAEAEPLLRRCLQIDRKLFAGKNELNIAIDLNNLGRLLLQKREFEESNSLFEQAAAIFRKARHPWLAACMGNQGEILIAKGEYQKAEKVLSEALELGIEQFGNESQDVVKIRAKYGQCLLKQKKYDLAKNQLEIALPILQSSLGVHGEWTQRTIDGLVVIYDARGDARNAARLRALRTPQH
jgi:eukaryotic-like serine/threonine-protein kinase